MNVSRNGRLAGQVGEDDLSVYAPGYRARTNGTKPMTTIDVNGALHDNLGKYANQNQPAAGFDLGGTSAVSATIMADIAARRRIDDDVTGAVTGASLVTDMGDEMFYPKDASEAFRQDSDSMFGWSDDPHRGRDFMEVRVGPHVMFIDPVVNEATGEVLYESPDGDWAFTSSDADEMTECVGDFLRSEVKDHPARRLEAFKNEGLASEYGATMDPETAALLVVRDKIDEATLPGTVVDDGTVESPAGAWDELPVDALKVLRDAEGTQRYWAEQYYAVRERRDERERAESLVAGREKMIATCKSTLGYQQAVAELPISEDDLATGRTPYQVEQERRDAVAKAEKGLEKAQRWLTNAQSKVDALPEPFKKAYADDVLRGFEESTAALDKTKREANHRASAAEIDLGFTVDSNTLTPEDVLEIRNEYAGSKRIAPERVRRDDLRSISHDAAITKARAKQAALRADMLTDELAARGVPAVVATFKDDAHVPSDLDSATISGTRWNDGWRRLSEGEPTFVRFTDSYTDTARAVRDVTDENTLRRRKGGAVVSGQSFHGDDKRLALRGGTTWDVVDDTSKVAVTGMGRTNTRLGYVGGAVDEGETSWVLDQAAGDGHVPLF